MNQRGFTLLEVLVCLVIFSVGLLSIGAMQALSIKNNSFGANVTQATQLVKAELEYLKDLPPTSSELFIGSNVRTISGTIFSLRRIVADRSGNLELTVSVLWKDWTDHSITLKTLRPKNG